MPIDVLTVEERNIELDEVLNLVQRLIGDMRDVPVTEGATAALMLYILLASPRPLAPDVLVKLIHECSKVLAERIAGELAEKPTAPAPPAFKES